MSGFEADADRLAARAKDLDGVTQRAKAIATELAAELDATGEPWGTDGVGRAFAAGHVEPAAAAFASLHALPELLGGFGWALADAANAYRATDSAATDAVGRTERG